MLVKRNYLYGTRKRASFHSEAFAARLNRSAGSRVLAYKCAHWVMHEQPKRFNRDVRAFLKRVYFVST